MEKIEKKSLLNEFYFNSKENLFIDKNQKKTKNFLQLREITSRLLYFLGILIHNITMCMQIRVLMIFALKIKRIACVNEIASFYCKIKNSLVLLFLFWVLYGCNNLSNEPPPSEIPIYDFPVNLIPNDIQDIACFDGPSGQSLAWLGDKENEFIYKLSKEITTKEEVTQALAFHRSLTNKFNIIEDHRTIKLNFILQNLVKTIYRALPEMVHPDYRIFLIKAVEGEYLNAFTVGGGYLYFTTDLYAFTKNDTERAFIIAHELAHQVLGHCADHARRKKLSKAIFGKLGWDNTIHRIWEVAITPTQQKDELLCDIFAVHTIYFTKIYDPEVGLYLYHRLGQLSKDKFTTRIFSSHPPSEIRMACLGNYLFSAKIRGKEILSLPK